MTSADLCLAIQRRPAAGATYDDPESPVDLALEFAVDAANGPKDSELFSQGPDDRVECLSAGRFLVTAFGRL